MNWGGFERSLPTCWMPKLLNWSSSARTAEGAMRRGRRMSAARRRLDLVCIVQRISARGKGLDDGNSQVRNNDKIDVVLKGVPSLHPEKAGSAVRRHVAH